MSDNQRIRRSPKNAENPFAQISREMLQDKSLSYEARGLLSYLLSKTGNWEARVSDLRIQGAGRDKVYRVIAELQAKGYISERQKFQDEKGQWQWTPYDVYETPNLKPCPENPYTDEPYTEKAEIYKTENDDIENTKEREKRKEKNAASHDAAPAPSQTDVPSQSSSSLQGNENYAHEENPPKAGKKAKDELQPPTHSAPPPPKVNAAAELAKALGITIAGDDGAFYGGIAKKMLKGMTVEDFPAHVAFVKGIAEKERWNFTPSSLVSAGRVSLFVTHKAKLDEQMKYARPLPPEPDPSEYMTPERYAERLAEMGIQDLDAKLREIYGA